ncbi:MAG: hypothetical protein J6A59_07720 [Lachnospiraceae bacterium]|nr:hypothetical protein [Lachnospiraceae bacterium]
MDLLDDTLDKLDLTVEELGDTTEKLKIEAEQAGMNLYGTEKEVRQHEIFYHLTASDRDQAVTEGIVPKVYRDSSFNEDKITENLRAQYVKTKGLYKVYKYREYINLCIGILSAIRMKQLPSRSYLIGAPNGFGKTSFVNECLITLRRQGFKVAPYISLWELAQIRVDNEQRIMNPYKKFKDEGGNHSYTEPNTVVGYLKKPEIVTGRFSYSEYINADCLFVSFTDVISKDIESHTLYQLLSIRGAKGLPTIVMMSTSLEPYENDRTLKELVWDEIRTYDELKYCYDRVYHVSCYKRKSIGLENKDKEFDKDTGVVN